MGWFVFGERSRDRIREDPQCLLWDIADLDDATDLFFSQHSCWQV